MVLVPLSTRCKELGDALEDNDDEIAALVTSLANETTARTNADAALSGRLDTLEADPTTQTLLDAETTARTTADSALDGRVSTLEGNAAITDPTTATAVAAVQSDVDANETASVAADAALSGRLDVLEADPTTQADRSSTPQSTADVDRNDAADARTTLGLGDVATTAAADYATAAQGALADTAVQPAARQQHRPTPATPISRGKRRSVQPMWIKTRQTPMPPWHSAPCSTAPTSLARTTTTPRQQPAALQLAVSTSNTNGTIHWRVS